MPGRTEKIKSDDPGITIGGVPLEKHVEKEEREGKGNDLEDTRREEIGTKSRNKKTIRPREKYEDDPRRVHRRVRRLSEWEIRKEYGVKEKPFPTLTQNVMYVLFEAGDQMIGSKAISEVTGKNLPDVSSCLSNIFKKLKGDNAIIRDRIGMAYQYKIPSDVRDIGFDALYRKYFPGMGKKLRERLPSPDLERTGPFKNANLPYKNISHNVIHLMCIAYGEEFTTRELAGGVGKLSQNISSAIQKVVRRLEPHNMIKLTGPMSQRTYQLHPDLSDIDSKDMIEFLFSRDKHWEKDLNRAWAFWRAREDKKPDTFKATRKVEEEPTFVPLDPEEIMANFAGLLRRVEAIENDGLAELVHDLKQQIQEKFVAQPSELTGTAPTNEFTINIRFLFGRAS